MIQMWRFISRRQTATIMAWTMRKPLTRLAANESSCTTITSISSFKSQQNRFLSAQTTLIKNPPRIQAWMDRKSPVKSPLSIHAAEKAKEDLLLHTEKMLDEMTNEDPEWLEGVVKEIRNDVLVGSMSESVHNLCHSLMRYLRKQGFMAQIVEDLLLRLLEEEDSGTGRPVNAVLYSIAIDAWAKQFSCSDAPQRAEALLQLMQDRFKKNPVRCSPPRASHVSLVMVAWSNSSLSYAPQRAEQLLTWMEGQSNKFPPCVYTYTSVIHAYSRHGKPHDAERILRLMEARMEKDPKHAVRANVKTFTAVVGAWANANQGRRGAQRAENARKRLEKWYKRLQDEELQPKSIKLLTLLMQAWAKSGTPEQGRKVEALWKALVDLHSSLSDEERNDPSNRITVHPYNMRMEAWSKADEPEKAEKILFEMLDRVKAGDEDAVAPRQLSWTIVSHGWGRIGNVERTENVLKRMHEQYVAGVTSTKRTVVIYNALLLAWLKSKDKDSAIKAQRLLDWMEEQADNGMEELRPNEISYDLVMTAWSKSTPTRQSETNALELLRRMENYLKKHPIISQNAVASAYEKVLSAVARGDKGNTHLKVLELLKRIETIHASGSLGPILNNLCYHIAIAACAWAPTRDGEELAEDILQRMELSLNDEFRPRKRSYEATLAAWGRSFRADAHAHAHSVLKRLEDRAAQEPDSPYEPTNKAFNFVLSACIPSKAPGAADIAREVLDKMVAKRRNGDETMCLSTGTFKLLFGNKFEKRDTISAEPVEDLIHQLESSFHDNPIDEEFLFDCYLYALFVWGWSTETDAVARAEQLFEQMNASRNVSPSLECFNSLLRAYTNEIDRSKNPDKAIPIKADELLRNMEREYASGNSDWRPDSVSYDCVIEIWAKSRLPNAPERAFQFLERMDASFKTFDSDHVKPSGSTYGMVLLACALTPAPDEASKLHHFNIAVRTFNKLRESEYCEPDRNLYNRLLMCAIYLAPDRKTQAKMTRHIFSLCCSKWNGFQDSTIVVVYNRIHTCFSLS